MNKSIGPHEILTPGTRVQVKNYRGAIVSHIVAENGVVVHTIKFDQKMRKVGNRFIWEPCKEHARECNYSFVYPL